MRWSWCSASSRPSASRSRTRRWASRRSPRSTRSPTSSPPSAARAAAEGRRRGEASGHRLLPHEYPFRLLDRRADGTVVALITGNAAQVRGAEELPAFLAIELLAQSAIFAL